MRHAERSCIVAAINAQFLDLGWNVCRPETISLTHMHSQSWSSAVDALNATYLTPSTWPSCPFDLWCCPLCSCLGFISNTVASCSTFAPERLIGIFWVRRRNLSKLPCVRVLYSFIFVSLIHLSQIKKMWGEVVILWKGPLGGPFPPSSPFKKTKEREELTHD